MPSILLINDNKIVSRLLQLSSQKHEYQLEEINDYTASESSYNIIFIDSEKYDENALEALKETLTFDKLGYIGDKSNTKPDGFDLILEKPFLPTDFVSLMDENFKMVSSTGDISELETIEDIVGENELDLDSLDDVELDGELDVLEEMDGFDLELDDEELEDISAHITEPETTLTTGIVDSVVEEDSNAQLANMVDEIDSMEDEVLEEMDLDALDEEDEISSIVDEEIVKESLGEAEVTSEVEEIIVAQESDTDESSMIGTLATVAAVVSAEESTNDEDIDEELEETLNSLDGIESIEKEDDYLQENDHMVEDLADEFDSLNETEVAKLMAGEEVVVSEEFTSGEDKVVESNDLEEMITRAVAKAITKEMLQEALNDMEITFSIKTKSKES